MDVAKTQEWVKILEETDLPQVKGMLGDESVGMCCMGVANVFIFDKADAIGSGYMRNAHGQELGLTKGITEEDIRKARVCRVGASRGIILAKLNDEDGLSFGEIAEFIKYMGWDKE